MTNSKISRLFLQFVVLSRRFLHDIVDHDLHFLISFGLTLLLDIVGVFLTLVRVSSLRLVLVFASVVHYLHDHCDIQTHLDEPTDYELSWLILT